MNLRPEKTKESWPKEFFDLCFIGSVGFDDYLTDPSLAISCSLPSDFVLVVRLAYSN
jgi:hypothetical protein